MHQFILGTFFGILLMGIMTYIAPLHLTGVQKKLIAQGHATYHPLTRELILKECK